MVPHNDNTPTSQITLSQYEYRVVRLPKRDYTRRRRHRQSLNSISSVQRQLVTESEADLLVVPSSETTADDADTSQLLNVQSLESNERRQHSPQPNKVSAQQHFHSSSIPNIANESQLYPHVDAIPLASTSPLPMPMQMQMNDDDRELLRLASPCDSDVPLRDADKSRGSRSEIRALTPGSATPTRGSVDSSCQDERPRRPTKKATKKRKNKLSDLNLLGNQLVMVAGEPEHTVSVNDEPTSSIDDDIEDSQLYGPAIKKPRAVYEAQKTVSGTQLRRKYSRKFATLPREQLTTPVRKRGHGLYQDVGDGFEVDERTMVISVSRSHRLPKSRPRPRTHAITVPSLEVGHASNQVTSSSELRDQPDTMPSIETADITQDVIEDDHEPDQIGHIVKMAATLRSNGLLQTSKHLKAVSRTPIARRNDRQALQMPLAISISSRTYQDDAQQGDISRHITKRAKRTCKASRSNMAHLSTAASRGDGFAVSHSPTPALSRPGNLSMMTNLHYDEEEEPIEDDNPPGPRPSYYAPSRTITGLRPLFPSKSILNITPRHALNNSRPEAAYPTPQTTARVLPGGRTQHGSPVKPFNLRVSRGQYNDLADDMVRGDAGENAAEDDDGYTRPHTAGKASGVNNTQSTQVARYGMAFDDNSEVLWDGSMRSSTFSSNIPRARPRKPVAGGTISKAPATAMVKVAPQVVKLKHLTRTVSRKSGTLSPEKGMQRRTSVLSTFKAPFKPQRTGDHEPMMREKR